MKIDIGKHTIKSTGGAYMLLLGEEIVSSHPSLELSLRSMSHEVLQESEIATVEELLDAIHDLKSTISRLQITITAAEDPKKKDLPTTHDRVFNKVELAFIAHYGREPELPDDVERLMMVRVTIRGDETFFTPDEIKKIKEVAGEAS